MKRTSRRSLGFAVVALVLVINGLADLAYRLLDPRLRDPDQERTL